MNLDVMKRLMFGIAATGAATVTILALARVTAQPAVAGQPSISTANYDYEASRRNLEKIGEALRIY